MKTKILAMFTILTFGFIAARPGKAFTHYFPCDGSTLIPGQNATYCRLPVPGKIRAVTAVYAYPPNWQIQHRPNDCFLSSNIPGAPSENYSFDANGVYAWGGCNGGFVVEVESLIRTVTHTVGCPTPGYPNVNEVYKNQGYFNCAMDLPDGGNVVPGSISVALTADYSPGRCTVWPRPDWQTNNGSWLADINYRAVTVFDGCYASFTVTYQVQD